MDRSTGTSRRLGAIVGLFIVLAATLAPSTGLVRAQSDGGDGGDDAEQRLAERFVPVMMLKEQPEPCSNDGEPYGPTNVDILFDNPEIVLRQVGRSDPVIKVGPSGADLYELGEGFFLDFPGSSLDPGCIFERDFDKYSADVAPTVYAHIVQDPSEPNLVFLQYWFYWYYNDWNNKHESDWEGITLLFEASSVAEALEAEPVAVGYSQHEGGERSEWDDPKLERDGDRPVVYSSSGSHASYFGSALYLGRSASEGFGCDDTSGPSSRVDPEVIVLPDEAISPDDEFAWLAYAGRWGERQGGAFNGPTGPPAKDRWLEPAPWFEELRESSVVIPSGDSETVSVIDVFCTTVEAGSSALVAFTVSPARVLVGVVLAFAIVSFVVRRTTWDRVAGTPIVLRRRAGQIIRLILPTFIRRPGSFLLFGLVYVPAALLAGVIAFVLELVPFVGALLSVAGSTSGTNFVLAVFAGSLANTAAFVVVNGLTGHYLHHGASGMQGATESLKAVWAHRLEFLGAVLRAFLIVGALLVTVIGIPWAIRQVVRYQFLGQAIMVDHADGQGALGRSTELVRGRWFHTLVVTASLNGVIGFASILVGLLLLVLAAGLPLWLFSAVLTLVSVLVVPLASIAMSYLHADAVAQHDHVGRAPVLVESMS